ncbi:hypothetical protein CEW92_12730 [Bacillaceae bacterium SAS-127]|nr:hypothetical protein CEW92_12730 [Bacillaceae bacterium SAS-127]
MRSKVTVGIILFSLYIISQWESIHPAEMLLLLSMLIFVPITWELTDQHKRDGQRMRLAKVLAIFYVPAVLSAYFAIIGHFTILACIWFAYTICASLFGVFRLLERGVRPIAEVAIDSGWMYLGLGGFWFFAYVSELPIMHFSRETILLTVIHFHYSAFIIPIISGLLGRKISEKNSLYSFILMLIIVSPMTIAVGITYSRWIEFIAVVVYAVALYMYGFFVVQADFRNKSAKLLVSFSSAVLLVTIFFSFLYAYGRLGFSGGVTIKQMIFIHGVVNAFGVVLPALIGWLIEGTSNGRAYYGKPMSLIFGDSIISERFLTREKLIDERTYHGLVDDMEHFCSKHFDKQKLAPSISQFYEQTENYQLKAFIQWASWFKPLAFLYEKVSRHVQQIHLSAGGRWEMMTGEVVAVQSSKDGREHVRAWVRNNDKGETIFVALYSQHTYKDETYMNIALPLPFSNMTGILRFENEGKNLILSSKGRTTGNGDEGIYLRTPLAVIRLPLAETFIIKEKSADQLMAHHQMWIFGVKFLEINYEIEKRAVEESS